MKHILAILKTTSPLLAGIPCIQHLVIGTRSIFFFDSHVTNPTNLHNTFQLNKKKKKKEKYGTISRGLELESCATTAVGWTAAEGVFTK